MDILIFLRFPSDCEFPDSWNGTWYLEATRGGGGGLGSLGLGDGSTVVSRQHFGAMGTCHAEMEHEAKYVLHSEYEGARPGRRKSGKLTQPWWQFDGL